MGGRGKLGREERDASAERSTWNESLVKATWCVVGLGLPPPVVMSAHRPWILMSVPFLSGEGERRRLSHPVCLGGSIGFLPAATFQATCPSTEELKQSGCSQVQDGLVVLSSPIPNVIDFSWNASGRGSIDFPSGGVQSHLCLFCAIISRLRDCRWLELHLRVWRGTGVSWDVRRSERALLSEPSLSTCRGPSVRIL